MKAIYLTQELKDKNAEFFANNDVDNLVAKNVASLWIINI